MTIGYLTNGFYSSYNATIWEGLREVCEERNISFFSFSGGELNHPDDIDLFQRNKLYNLISKEYFDGLIINAATIFHHATKDDIDAFYEKFQNIPIVNLGIKYKNIATVSVDNTTGIHDGIIHLIKEHGFKKIAFIRGPVSSPEAESRYNVYTNVLKQSGIKPDPRLISIGNFTKSSGMHCLKTILAENEKVEAVVCANDYMALGAFMKAREMGIVVPNILAIMGFDDIKEGEYSNLPLTTVRQPIVLQAKKAVELLFDRIEYKKILHDVVLPTELVIRRSCGCFSETTLHASIANQKNQSNIQLKDLKKDSQLIMSHLTDNKKQTENNDTLIMQYLLDIFINYMENEDLEKAISLVDMKLNQVVTKEDINMDGWQNILSDFINIVIPYIKSDTSAMIKAESFFHQSRILIQEIGFNSYRFQEFQTDFKIERTRWMHGGLVSIFSIKELIHYLSEIIPNLWIEEYYLSLYEDKHQNSEYSRILLAYLNNRLENIPPGGIRYKTKAILPEKIKKAHTYTHCVVDALFYRDEHFGYVVYKKKSEGIFFENLTQQVSSAIKRAFLIREVNDKENKLKILLDDQKKRAEELENAYKTLQENQEKMIISEKMASLGRLTAGIAHEMNTPLAAVRTSLEELKVLVDEYKQSIGNAEINKKDHYEITDDMNKAISLSKKAAERVVRFVNSIKFQTRDFAPKHHFLFKPKPVIEDSILLLNHSLKKNNCSIVVNSDDDMMELYGTPIRFSQVITNLVTNAINAIKKKGGGVITINLTYNNSNIDIHIKDTGNGIDKDTLPKIFDPLFTTEIFNGGTGLGLSIVHDIITGDFRGSIEVVSTPGEGTTFILHLPKPQEKKSEYKI